ncbi:MAG: M24 family metallopeptidase, partial [Nitrososphaerales archaeon]
GGYTTQVGKPISLGRPTKYYRQIFDAAKESYDNIVDQMRPGRSLEDIQSKGGAPLKESGLSMTQTPLVHGLGIWNEEPRVSIDSIRFDGPCSGKFKLKPGMTFSVQPNPVSKDRRFGLFLADTYAVTVNGPKCMMNDPMRLVEI